MSVHKILSILTVLLVLLFQSCFFSNRSEKVIHVVLYSGGVMGKSSVKSYLVKLNENCIFKLGTQQFYLDRIISDTTIDITIDQEVGIAQYDPEDIIKVKELTLHKENLAIHSLIICAWEIYNFRIIDTIGYSEFLRASDSMVIEITEFENIENIVFERNSYNLDGTLKQQWFDRFERGGFFNNYVLKRDVDGKGK